MAMATPALRAHPRKPGRSPVLKKMRLGLQVARGAATVALRFPFLDPLQRGLAFQRWSRRMLAILEIEVEALGEPPEGFAGLVVSNHLSWLDILVLQSLQPAAFVAKAEVRRWPVFGWLSHACGTIFVNRGSARSAHAMVEDTAAAMARGHAVAVFPEGTSSDGATVGPFHPNIFESAIRARAPVLCLSLHYQDPATRAAATAAHFTGDMTLVESLDRILASPGIRARVHRGACLPVQGHTRKSIALLARQHIHHQLQQLHHAL